MWLISHHVHGTVLYTAQDTNTTVTRPLSLNSLSLEPQCQQLKAGRVIINSIRVPRILAPRSSIIDIVASIVLWCWRLSPALWDAQRHLWLLYLLDISSILSLSPKWVSQKCLQSLSNILGGTTENHWFRYRKNKACFGVKKYNKVSWNLMCLSGVLKVSRGTWNCTLEKG